MSWCTRANPLAQRPRVDRSGQRRSPCRHQPPAPTSPSSWSMSILTAMPTTFPTAFSVGPIRSRPHHPPRSRSSWGPPACCSAAAIASGLRCSSNYPRFDRNPNTGGDITTQRSPMTARQSVHRFGDTVADHPAGHPADDAAPEAKVELFERLAELARSAISAPARGGFFPRRPSYSSSGWICLPAIRGDVEPKLPGQPRRSVGGLGAMPHSPQNVRT